MPRIASDPRLPGDPGFVADPYPYYDRLREADPVYWSPGLASWVLTRYADVAACLRDLRFSSRRMEALVSGLTADGELRRTIVDRSSAQMISSDPPDHGRRRALMRETFAPARIEALRPWVRDLANGLVDRVAASGRMEVLSDFAFPLPMTVISRILGIPPEDGPMVKQWADGIVAFLASDVMDDARLQAYIDSWSGLAGYFQAAAAARRQAGSDDVIGHLVAKYEAGAATEAEVLSNLVLLAVAGHETTTNTIATGLWSLLRHPDQLLRLQRDPDLIPSAVEEILRFEPVSQRNIRIATADITIDGRQIRAGQMVLLLLGAANRDPDEFPDPNRLDVTRSPNRHLTFSYGIHFCLGAHLARVEAQVALATLLERCRSIRLDGPEPTWRDNVRMRGLNGLAVRFDPSPAT